MLLGRVNALGRGESVDRSKGRQGWASMVKKLKVRVRGAKVCVSGNTLLVIKPRDGMLQESRLLLRTAIGLELWW